MSYLSITGLRLKRPWYAPRFWWLAHRAMAEARAAEGCLLADACTIEGVHHTVSLWTDRARARAYVPSKAHLAAMRAYPAIAEGKVLGLECDEVPEWPELHRLWLERGRPV